MDVKELQEKIKRFRELKTDYEEKKRVSSDAHAVMKVAEMELIEILEDLGQDSFEVKGYGKAILVKKLSVTTPKTLEEKKAFFGWLKEHQGQDVADAYMSVNSSSLNSLYKNLSEEYAKNGEVLQIDGLQMPTTRTEISFRKA